MAAELIVAGEFCNAFFKGSICLRGFSATDHLVVSATANPAF